MTPKSGNRFLGHGHAQNNKVCVAKIGAAHGVRGEVRLWPFTEDPMALRNYSPLETADGARRFAVIALRAAKDHLVARLEGITTREDAEALTGLELHVPRERLPAPATGEYYHADLIGLAAVSSQGETVGRVVAVHNFGAGDILELAPARGGPTVLLPFSDAAVPKVNLAAGTITVVIPPADTETDA